MSKVEKHSVIRDILLTIITLGIFNFWVQIRQMVDTNSILGRNEFSATKTFVFSLLTLGAYFVYHEYILTKTLQDLVYGDDKWPGPFWTIPATFLALWYFVDSYQQSLLNLYIERKVGSNHQL